MRKGLVFIILLLFNFFFIYGINYANRVMFNNNFMIYLNSKDKVDDISDSQSEENNIIENTSYNGESIDKIGEKFNKAFKKTFLEGYGNYIASVSISKGINPYLIGGIILESTNCKRDCSIILKQCNNVSGTKGTPGCFGGSYKKYNTVEESISELVANISKDFYSQEMQVPLKMFKKYGKTEVWAFKVSNYMEELKKIK